jgi:hypothetical protein
VEPPDRAEKAVRLGCGALFGLVAAGLMALRLGGLSWPWLAGVAVGGCGYAAARHGDEFWWEALRRRWW